MTAPEPSIDITTAAAAAVLTFVQNIMLIARFAILIELPTATRHRSGLHDFPSGFDRVSLGAVIHVPRHLQLERVELVILALLPHPIRYFYAKDFAVQVV